MERSENIKLKQSLIVDTVEQDKTENIIDILNIAMTNSFLVRLYGYYQYYLNNKKNPEKLEFYKQNGDMIQSFVQFLLFMNNDLEENNGEELKSLFKVVQQTDLYINAEGNNNNSDIYKRIVSHGIMTLDDLNQHMVNSILNIHQSVKYSDSFYVEGIKFVGRGNEFRDYVYLNKHKWNTKKQINSWCKFSVHAASIKFTHQKQKSHQFNNWIEKFTFINKKFQILYGNINYFLTFDKQLEMEPLLLNSTLMYVAARKPEYKTFKNKNIKDHVYVHNVPVIKVNSNDSNNFNLFTPITSIFSTPIGIAGFNDNFKPFLENKGGNVVKATIGTDYINDIEQVSQLALID